MMDSQFQTPPALLLITRHAGFHQAFQRASEKENSFSLIIATDIEEAYDYLYSTAIDTIVIDDKISEGNTKQLCTYIQTLHTNASNDTAIILITTRLKKSLITHLLNLGVSEFISPPLEEEDLFLRIELAKKHQLTHSKMKSLSAYLPNQPSSSTPLNQRAIINDQCIKLIEKSSASHTSLALILIHIDQYPNICSEYGDPCGQSILTTISTHFHQLIRKQDLLCNENHGKFAIFLPKTSLKAATFIAENIQEYLDKERFTIHSQSQKLTLSIGISSLSQAGDNNKSATVNLERLLNSAALCLEQAMHCKNTIISTHNPKDSSL